MNKTMMLPALDQGFEIIGNIPKYKIAGYASGLTHEYSHSHLTSQFTLLKASINNTVRL